MVPIEGVDVSAHNPTLPHTGGLGFIFARACYGGYVDPLFQQHIEAARDVGLLTGAYLFLLPAKVLGQSIDYQVEVFLREARAAKVNWFCIDWENEANHAAPSKAELIRAVRLVQAAGLPCGVYSSEGYPYPAVGQDWRWVANYSREPRIRYDIWQYQGDGLDRDRMKTPLAEFRKKAERSSAPTEVQFILAYDPPQSIEVPSGTKYLDLKGGDIGTQPTPTKLVTVGLADGHSGHFVVKIRTKKFAPDGQAREYFAQALIPGGDPQPID